MLQSKTDMVTEPLAGKEGNRQGAALLEIFGAGETPAMRMHMRQCPEQWIRELAAALPFHLSMPVFEHIYGVIPLVAEYFEISSGCSLIAGIEQGTVPVSLGLFTPNPSFSIQASAFKATREKNGLSLSGRVRVATANSTYSLVLAELGNGEMRLALVENPWQEAKQPGNSQPYWLTLEGVVVDGALISKAVDTTLSHLAGMGFGSFSRCLNRYAAAYALATSVYVEWGIGALRKAAREAVHNGVSMNTSQLVAMGITELEIQSQLLNTAVRGSLDSNASGFALAAAAARLLAEVVTRTTELAGKAGLPVTGPLLCMPEAGPGVTDAVFGGQWMTESLLAETMGL